MTSDLSRRLLAHIRSEHLFPDPGLALLAVSGGPDSVALLDLLHGLAPEIGLTVAVAHVDHGILPRSADVARQVRSLAERYGVPYYDAALRLGPGASETRARRERYRALREIQGRVSARYLVTAHHADDQVETVLLRVLKGSGPAGLAGMRPAGPGGLVRPLLSVTRRELSAWLGRRFPDAASAPPTFQDPANADPRSERSWIRHHLIPPLRERLGEAVERRLLDLAHHAWVDRLAWSQVLGAMPELKFRSGPGRAEVDQSALARLPDPLALSLLRAAARAAGAVLGPGRAAHVLRFVRSASSGRAMQLKERWMLDLAFGRVRIFRRPVGDALPPAAHWGGRDSGAVRWAGWEITWQPDAAGVAARNALQTWVTPGTGAVRALATGDRVRPVGGTGRRPVRRLLMEARVPRSDRLAYPIVVRDDTVLWIPGVCRATADLPRPGDEALRLQARRLGET